MYNSNKVTERIKIIAKKRGVKIKKLLEDIGLNKNALATMKNYMPRSDSLGKIADYLDCSVDYLLGRVDSPDFQENEKNLINIYRKMNSIGQERLINYANDLLRIDEYKKCDNSEDMNVG